MKVHVEFEFGSVAGGGNSFLGRLKDEFDRMFCTSSSHDAEVILFNSHHSIDEVNKLMDKYPEKIFVHRVDGPMRLYNNGDDKRDDKVCKINARASGTVFQSEWSKRQSRLMYPVFQNWENSTVILNSCDSVSRQQPSNEKVVLIATSVSKNMNKGFNFYKYLDDNLDFDTYEFLFVGSSLMKFKNIQMLGVKKHTEVIDILKKADIFITASHNDPCSNSLIEALATGLPCVAKNSGGHPEILKGAGGLFMGINDMVDSIESVYQNRRYYESQINIMEMNEVAERYLSFFRSLR